ncbi:DNA-binding transcriptional regulator, FadR family [Brevibacterium jeotgali]|uniref:DNA-binding transcriptional regulator, FadR family n=2 Tax=Brevibacterium jeotgali TaxID=1262550 RepID=A0A2H1L795_9MICO|nr:GntR family transcriptional regulator [Brevibacterium jeotgali]SMY12635.1 DNA-binding transcriptional regulator, FadR family [Brevibacterium jeotgali]
MVDMAGKSAAGPAYAAVADSIRGRILSGELRPGTRLPTESQLIEAVGKGRGTIREAIRTLESEHLVYTTRGVSGGTFVATPSVGVISAQMETGMTLLAAADHVSADQLMEVRRLTEVPAAGRAAFSRTDEQLAAMRATFQSAPNEGSYDRNQDFHFVVLQAAGNPLLELVTAPVFSVLHNRFRSDRVPEGYRDQVDDEHRRVYEAIAAGDSMTAMQEMRRHLDQFDRTFRHIDGMGDV